MVFKVSKAVKSTTQVTLSLSGAANPSGMNLDEGGSGITKSIDIGSSTKVPIPLTTVRTARDNQLREH